MAGRRGSHGDPRKGTGAAGLQIPAASRVPSGDHASGPTMFELVQSPQLIGSAGEPSTDRICPLTITRVLSGDQSPGGHAASRSVAPAEDQKMFLSVPSGAPTSIDEGVTRRGPTQRTKGREAVLHGETWVAARGIEQVETGEEFSLGAKADCDQAV